MSTKIPADEMTVPTYEREPTPVITPRPGVRFALQRAPSAATPLPVGAAGRLGIGASSNQRASRLGIGSALASRAIRLGPGSLTSLGPVAREPWSNPSTCPPNAKGLTPVIEPGDEEKSA